MVRPAAQALHPLFVLTLAALTLAAAAPNDDSAGMSRGKVELRSAGELAFGPGSVLFVGDSRSGVIWAIDVEEEAQAVEDKTIRVEGVDERIAAALGTTPRDILIHDLAAYRPAQSVYLSVSRGRGNDAVPALVRVDHDGSIETLSLDDRPHTKFALTDVPSEEDLDRRGNSKRTMAITDLAYHDGSLYVAGLSNQEFASTLRRIPYPFGSGSSTTSIEIYHGAHGQYETHAPIRTLTAYEIEGEPHVLASYTCTPLVTFPVDALQNGQHVKGKTVAELGFGNTPRDMITYSKEGEDYLLLLNSSRSGMKIKISDIAAAESITTSEEAVTYGVEFIPLPLAGILHLDVLNDQVLVALRRDLDTGALHLGVASMRFL